MNPFFHVGFSRGFASGLMAPEALAMLDEHGMCLRMDIHRCLHQLSPKHFEILDLIVNEGLSYAEAGNEMGLTQIQVKNQINYARRKLTKLMLMG